jgi:hypothetical protein
MPPKKKAPGPVEVEGSAHTEVQEGVCILRVDEGYARDL